MSMTPIVDEIRVLLVDDQPITEHLLRRMMEGHEGFSLTACDDPMEAENLADQVKPTIILLDLVMPGIDGLGLLSRFRRRKSTQRLPIIILSGQEDPEHKAMAFQNGANDFLVKLPDKIEMLARLRYHAYAYFNQLRADNHIQEVRRAELKYRNLFEHSLEAVFLADALTGEVVDCNQAASDLLTLPKPRMIGKNLVDLLVCQPADFFRATMADVTRMKRNIRSEISLMRPNGVTVMVDVSATFFMQEERFFSQWMLRDLTERKQLLQSLAETLNMAEAANRRQSEFLVTLEREVHPPLQTLSAISAHLESYQDLANDLLPSLASCGHNVAKLETFFGDMLELARIEAGQLTLRELPLNLVDLLESALAPFQARARQKNLTLDWEIHPHLPRHLLGDPLRLRQVLGHLVRNAITFIEKGQVHVSARPAHRPGEAHQVLFSVRDSGIGIPYQEQGTIFHPFHKVAIHQDFRSDELGLGLAICRKLVERMGGTIGVKSQPGEGSTFYFTVPLAGWEHHGDESMPIFPGTMPGLHRRLPLRPYRVLLLDMPKDDRIMLQAFLQNTPCTLDESYSASFADLYQIPQFDMILMDGTTSPLNTLVDKIRRIRQMEQLGSIHRVVLIALINHHPEDRRALLAAGCDEVMIKPIHRQDLLAFMDRMSQTLV